LAYYLFSIVTFYGTLNHCLVYSMDPDEVAAGCFEFRLRTRSFDLHQLRHASKLKKFGRLFRASSDGGVKQSTSVPSSPAAGSSPRQSPPRRRRFVRVVRDKSEDCTEDGRYVVHRYSEAYLERMNRERFVKCTCLYQSNSVVTVVIEDTSTKSKDIALN